MRRVIGFPAGYDDRPAPAKTFRPYRTTPGVVLAFVEDAVRFDLYREGGHLGAVLALRWLVQ